MKENKLIGSKQDIQEAKFELDVCWQIARARMKPGTRKQVIEAILDGIAIRRRRAQLDWMENTQDDSKYMP